MAETNHSVDRALGLLRILAGAKRPLRFTDLQQQTGIAKGTLHPLLASLEAVDFVSRSTAGYEISVGAFEIGTAMRAPASLRAAASPLLDALFEQHGETVHFGMLYQGDVVYLDRRDSVHALRYVAHVGSRKPAYGTALGKAMLAQFPDSAVAGMYPDALPALTATTLTTRAALLDALGPVRREGYAIESEESTPGVCCIGVAGQLGRLVYGLSITIPVQRMQAVDLPVYFPPLHATVTRLGRSLKATEYFGNGRLAAAPPSPAEAEADW